MTSKAVNIPDGHKLYRVSFTFTPDYGRDTHIGLATVTINVIASNKFVAMGQAWDTIKPLCPGIEEPRSVEATSIKSDC